MSTPESKKPAVRKVYVASDAVWDLRQGTLARISPDFAVAVTGEESYYTREEDLFSANGFTLQREIYQGVYEQYKQEILGLSMRTMIFDFLRSLCKEYIKHTVVTPFVSDFAIQINSYPFPLSEQEALDIRAAVKQELGQGIEVEVVYLPHAEITPKYAKENYSAMILYHYYDWMNLHEKELKKGPLLEVGFYVPKLFFLDRSKMDADLERELAKKDSDIFEQLEMIAKPYFTLQHLPISLFSAATPVNLPRFRMLVKAQS